MSLRDIFETVLSKLEAFWSYPIPWLVLFKIALVLGVLFASSLLMLFLGLWFTDTFPNKANKKNGSMTIFASLGLAVIVAYTLGLVR